MCLIIDDTVYYQDKYLVMMDCPYCGVPLIAIKEPTETITSEEKEYLECQARAIFGKNIRFDYNRCERMTNFHWHVIVEDESGD